jgi:hypothetical protein
MIFFLNRKNFRLNLICWSIILVMLCASFVSYIVPTHTFNQKAYALLYLRTKYESENRIEEAAIVSKLIHEEESDEIREYDGF